jgi:HK97 gp10 family phage protein
VPRRINASNRSELQKGLALVTKDMERVTRDLSGADSEPVRKAASVLAKNWRRLLSTQGGGQPSAPGSPPHAQDEGFRFRGSNKRSKPLRRTIGTAVVDGVRRVGSGDFRARLHEFGTAEMPPRPHGRVALEQSVGQVTDVLITESERAIEKARL